VTAHRRLPLLAALRRAVSNHSQLVAQEAVASSSHHRDERRSVLIISAPTVQWTVAAANEAEREAWLQALHDASGGAQSSCVSYDLEPDMCAVSPSRHITDHSIAQHSIADCTPTTLATVTSGPPPQPIADHSAAAALCCVESARAQGN
jgi:hypothetical protein